MLVREDLPLATQMCQAVHAAHEAGIRWGDPEKISSVVICKIPSEVDLTKAAYRIQEHGIPAHVFHEPDIGNEATALATSPVNGESRKIFRKYPLWNGGAK